MSSVTLKVSGMTCNHCVMRVVKALKELEGVEDAKVDLAAKTAVVTYDDSKVDAEDMADAIVEAGYKVG